MDQRRLTVSDFVIGEPLLWDVYAEGRKLLLRRGHIIANLHQIDELVQRGLFVDSAQVSSAQRCAEDRPKPQQEAPSTLRLINLANKRLERLLYGLLTEADAEKKILEVAQALGFACNVNSDVALACIHLNQAAANYAVRHCIDTAVVSMLIARGMRKSNEEILKITAAALTMNVGMLRQQDQLQGKAEPLSERDRESIRRHPEEGAALLRQAGIVDSEWLRYVRMHHENEDGSGYPEERVGIDIPQNAKIISLADRYCARISSRTYRKQLLPNAALRGLFIDGGKTIDPQLSTYFVQELGIYLPGTAVRLQNGEIGVVTAKGRAPNTPIVHALIGPRGAPLSFAIKRETSKELFAVREAIHPEQLAIRFSMQQLWGAEARL